MWSIRFHCLKNLSGIPTVLFEHDLKRTEVGKRQFIIEDVLFGIAEDKEFAVLNVEQRNNIPGLFCEVLSLIHDYSIKPHDDADYRTYTSATMLDAVQDFCADVVTSLSEDMDLSQHVLYLNERHKPWWIKCLRAKYHLDQDFTGPQSLVNKVPKTTAATSASALSPWRV